jgi:protein transport protein SEC61 subunit alpha
LYFFSQLLQKQFKNSFVANLLGSWQDQTPVGGLAYYLSPPTSISELWTAPHHLIFYSVFVLANCAFLSRMWIEIAGSAPRDVCRQLTEQDMTIEGGLREESMKRYLSRYIKTAASFGGFSIGVLCIVSDLFGALGTGTGIVLAVSIIY